MPHLIHSYAARFFADPKLTAEITGINLELVKRFPYILHKSTSTESTDLQTFKTYTKETAQVYVRLYPWYYIPSNRP